MKKKNTFADIYLPTTKLQWHKTQLPAVINLSSRTCSVAMTTQSLQPARAAPAPPLSPQLRLLLQPATCVVVVLADGSRSFLRNDRRRRWCCGLLHCVCPEHGGVWTQRTWKWCECLASLLLSLADSWGNFLNSGVRGTGKASPRGSEHSKTKKIISP